MKRKDFLKCLGIAPLGLMIPKLLENSGIARESLPKCTNHNSSDEEMNQDGYYFESGYWVMRAACVRLPYRKNEEITVSRDGKVIKKRWEKSYFENEKGVLKISPVKFRGDGQLPKEAQVCYDSWRHRWRIQDAPDNTRDKIIHLTWSTAPIVLEGENIPVIGRFV